MDRHARNLYAFLWHATFLALALTLTDINTVLPALIVKGGGTAADIGLLTAIMIGTPILGQLLFASYQHLKTRKKGFLLLGIYLRVAGLALVAVVLANAHRISGVTLIRLVFLFMFTFSLAGASAGVSYTDILGKSLQDQQRQRFFIARQILSSFAFLVSALIARRLLSRAVLPSDYVWIFALASGLLLVASCGFWAIDEPLVQPPNDGHRLRDVLKSIPGEIRGNRDLQRYIILVNLTGFGLALLPFYVALAKEHYGLTGSQVGTYLLIQILGMIVSNLLWSVVVRRFGFRGVMRGCIACGISLPLLALLLVRGPLWGFVSVFFIIGAGLSARRIAFDGLFVEITTDSKRGLHQGIVGATSLTTALFPLIAGRWIDAVGYESVFLLGALMVACAYPFASPPPDGHDESAAP